MEAVTEARAQVKYARISPRKVKIVCDLIRGKDARTARAILKNTPRAASEIMVKVLDSAVANAENNFGLDGSKLYVSQTYADPGPIMKRMQPVSKGRGYRINKRTSHITIVVREREEA